MFLCCEWCFGQNIAAQNMGTSTVAGDRVAETTLSIEDLDSDKIAPRRQAYLDIRAFRGKLKKKLGEILNNEAGNKDLFSPYYCAVVLSGEYRLEQLSGLLMRDICYKCEPIVKTERTTLEDYYVSAGSLIKIGAHCIPQVVDKIVSANNDEESRVAAYVLLAIEGKERAIDVLIKRMITDGEKADMQYAEKIAKMLCYIAAYSPRTDPLFLKTKTEYLNKMYRKSN